MPQSDSKLLENVYNNPYAFRARALEEVKRARRYPTFISMIEFDISHVNTKEEIENFETLDQFYTYLLNLVGRSVRDTDLISPFERGKIAILLIETPRDGAYALLERLKKTIKYFLCNNTKSPVNWRVPSRECFFPGTAGNNHDLLAALNELAS